MAEDSTHSDEDSCPKMEKYWSNKQASNQPNKQTKTTPKQKTYMYILIFLVRTETCNYTKFSKWRIIYFEGFFFCRIYLSEVLYSRNNTIVMKLKKTKIGFFKKVIFSIIRLPSNYRCILNMKVAILFRCQYNIFLVENYKFLPLNQ